MERKWEEAVRRGDVQALGQLLAAGVDINSRDRYGQTALMIAAVTGQSGAVSFLVEHGADLDHTAKYRLSALMLAVINGRAEIVRTLVEAGADLSLRASSVPGYCGMTALDLAVDQGRTYIAEILRRPVQG